MTTTVIITLCCLLLLAYLFDLTSSKTRIPSVILLLLLGWLVKELTSAAKFELPDLSSILPILGTVGLILIVLEGSLELELNKSKSTLIRQSLLMAFIPMMAMTFLLAWMFQYYGGNGFKTNLSNAIPFCIISSSIAIPSAGNLSRKYRDFVIYESSMSDIVGVVFFNFVLFNTSFGLSSFLHFGFEIFVIVLVSFIATILLSFLLSRISHHIKFAPIVLLVILIYEISKLYHLPSLLFIMIFGLSIGNLEKIKNFSWIQKFRPDELKTEVKKFKELVVEAAFIIRALFFLLFGYLLKTEEILNSQTLIWALVITVLIFVFRAFQLLLIKLPLRPLLFVAPRGLITILLFLSIGAGQEILLVNKSLIIQVIMLTALIMMFGLMATKKDKSPTEG
jgi:Kef-type K+ transport system membrane component KefB